MTSLSEESAGNGPLELGSSTGPGLRTRDGVAGDVAAVDVVLDSRVGGGVKGSALDAVGAVGARVG
jgi:hypothetical protein